MLAPMPNLPTTLREFCLTPEWPLPHSVKSGFSLRVGGVSRSPYSSLNLGIHVGDEPAAVGVNRQRWRDAFGVERMPFLNQVHGTHCVNLDSESMPGVADVGIAADAASTRLAGVACTVLVADCLPVLFCAADGRQIAAAHAGWRGLVGTNGYGVLEAALAAFERPSEVIAWLGPCIGPAAFEVGDEVRAAFVAHQVGAEACFQPGKPGKWWADLAALARLRLVAQGVAGVFGNDGSPAWCTFNNPLHFFSFRRDHVCGRMAASIWRNAV